MKYLVVLGAVTACNAPVATVASDPVRGPSMDQFEDVTSESGVTFYFTTPDFKAGGLAVADLDRDGLPDILATRRAGGLSLFHNMGGLRFEEVTTSGLDPQAAISAIAAVDLDNDGDLDLVLAGDNHAYVMANAGDGTFKQVLALSDTGHTEHVLAADLDGDGLVDLYFGNYDTTSLGGNTINRLYMNRGNLELAPPILLGAGCTWTTTAFDFDGDGDQDLYVANDTLLVDFGRPVGTESLTSILLPDLMLRNDGPGPDGTLQFTDIAGETGLATPRSSMGGVLGDLDGDGTLDLFVPNEGAKKLFLHPQSIPERFVEAASDLGVTAIARSTPECGPGTEVEACLLLSWGAVLSDFDLDGYDELLVDNGETVLGEPPPMVMFTRRSDVAFHEVSPNIAQLDARGMVATDLDGDGDQDLVISQREGPLVIYRNLMRPAVGTWLAVTLHGHTSNIQGLGAVVTVHLASGRTQMRAVGSGGMINTSSPAEAHFGLGREVVTALEVQWPSGRKSTLAGPVHGSLVIDEP